MANVLTPEDQQGKPILTVPLTWAENGRVLRISGTRIPLDAIVRAYRNGATAEEIASAYDTLRLADVYSVIAYYLTNRDEVEAYLLDRRKQESIARSLIEAQPGYAELRERLLARREIRAG